MLKLSRLTSFALIFVFLFSSLLVLAPQSAHAYLSPDEASRSQQDSRTWLYALRVCADIRSSDGDYFKSFPSDDEINNMEILTLGLDISVGHDAVPDGGTVKCKDDSAAIVQNGLAHLGVSYQEFRDILYSFDEGQGRWESSNDSREAANQYLIDKSEQLRYSAESAAGPEELERRMLTAFALCAEALPAGQVSSDNLIINGNEYRYLNDRDGGSTISVGHDLTIDGRFKCEEIFDAARAGGYDPITNGESTNPTDPTDPTDPVTFNGTIEPTCESLNPGLGWILCEVLRTVLDVLDTFVGWFINVLDVEFAEDQRTVLEAVWRGFRTIANAGFAIAFLFLIYSAATGGILSAYDVKRILPRMLIGAVAVQLSLFISLELLDLSNIVGQGVGDLILSPLPGGTSNTGAASFIVSGSPLGTADGGILDLASEGVLTIFLVMMLILAAIFSIGGLILMMIIFLVRNMGIVVLTVISPIAFVAWILPNTEGFFKKWWKYFAQLLMLYPIAAAFIASGRLVGSIWIGAQADNAGAFPPVDAENVGGRIIGTLAIFAPFFLATKILDFAGQSVGAIRNTVNGAREGIKNPKSGLARRTKDRAKSKAFGGAGSIGTYSGNNRFRKGLSSVGKQTVGRATRSKTYTRGAAQAHEAVRRTDDEDAKAAAVLLERGAAAAEAKGGQPAATAYLRDQVLDSSGKARKGASPGTVRAAAQRMTDMNDYDSLTDLMDSLDADNSAQSKQLRSQLIQDNVGTWSKKAPSLYKGGAHKGLSSLNPEKIGDVHDKALSRMLTDAQTTANGGGPDAAAAQASLNLFYQNFEKAATNGNLKGGLGSGTVQAVRGVGAHAGMSAEASASLHNIRNTHTEADGTVN